MPAAVTIRTLLDPLVAGGAHNRVNRSFPVTMPYIVFHQISGLPEIGLTEGYLGLTKCLYQVDVFAVTQEAARGIAVGVVKTAVTESTELEGILMFEMDGEYSPSDKSFQYITEYQIWTP